MNYDYYLRNLANISNSNVVSFAKNDYIYGISYNFYRTSSEEKTKDAEIDAYLESLWENYKKSGILNKKMHDDALLLWNELKKKFSVDDVYPNVSLGPGGTILFTYRMGDSYLEIEVEDDVYSVYYQYKGEPKSDDLQDFDRNASGLRSTLEYAQEKLMQTA